MTVARKRYRQDPKTGKMNGSIPIAVDPPEIDDPWRKAPAYPSPDENALPGYDNLFTAFSRGNRMPSQFDAENYAEIFLSSDHPAAMEVKDAFEGLDDTQQQYSINDQLSLVRNRLSKSPGVVLHGPADREEWQWWCQKQAARVSEENPSLAEKYLDLADGPVPTNYEFAYLMSSRFHAKSVAKSYDREMRYLAGYHGRDPDDMKTAVELERQQYLALPDSEKPSVPSWFKDGIDSSYWGRDRSRRPPLDAATTWGLYSVLSNPAIAKSYPSSATSEYVVFDTETTGLSNTAEIVQITAIRYNEKGEEQERISTYLRPTNSAVFDTEEAIKAGEITGITFETVKDAPTFGEIAPELRNMMTGRTLVAHNLMFDYPRVQRAFAENSPIQEGSRDDRVLPLGPIVDTLRLARWVQPNPGVPRKEWKHTLEQSCRRAQISFDADEAHDALYDVERTNELFRYLRSAPLGG